MSLFFEDEIQKAMQHAKDADLENILSQDPRNALNRNRRNGPPFLINREMRRTRQNPFIRIQDLKNENENDS